MSDALGLKTSSPVPQSPSIEMLLAERAKAMQQASPSLKGLTDVPGFGALGSGGLAGHPLFPGAPTGMEAVMGLMNDEVMSQWRKSLEQSSALLQQQGQGNSSNLKRNLGPIPPMASITPPGLHVQPPPPTTGSNHSSQSPSSTGAPPHSSGSPLPGGDTAPGTPSNLREVSPSSENRSDEHRPPSNTGAGKGTKSEDGNASPPARLESKSPLKPNFEVDQPSPASSTQSPLSAFPHGSVHSSNPAMSLPLPMPMSVPPLMSTGRIPKSDPMEAKLQDMLRYNMEKYAGQALDTLGMSRRVRELLSIHNIGQRLFAKYVLGLSQGTVSELLSKPKSWEKLTEKGRDSYRKMHAWAYDNEAIMLLKSLIPRKGELMRSISSTALLTKGT